MGDIGAISEHDMVLAFLRAEFDAPRYRDFYLAALRSVGGSRQHLIDDADLDNPSDKFRSRETARHGSRIQAKHNAVRRVPERHFMAENRDFDNRTRDISVR
jgi:hypothetical protein